MNIAIVRLSSLGDIVFSAPVACWLKRIFPQSKISWYVDEEFAHILKDSIYIDEIITINLRKIKKSKNFKDISSEFSKLINAPKYDYIIDLQGLLKSALIVKFLKGRKIGFDFKSAREGVASFFYDKKISCDYNQNILTRYKTLIASSFGSFDSSYENILGVNSQYPRTKDAVLINVGASKANKRYPFFADLIPHIKRDVFLIWGNNDELEIAKEISHKTNAIILPRLDINELKCAIKSSALVIGGDSGITHLAWALDVPSIILFGATPYERNCVQTDINIAISANKNIDAKSLDYNDFSIEEIPPELILQTANKLLNDW